MTLNRTFLSFSFQMYLPWIHTKLNSQLLSTDSLYVGLCRVLYIIIPKCMHIYIYIYIYIYTITHVQPSINGRGLAIVRIYAWSHSFCATKYSCEDIQIWAKQCSKCLRVDSSNPLCFELDLKCSNGIGCSNSNSTNA